MYEKLRPHFLKIGARKFVILAVLVLIVLDILNSLYLRKYWQSKSISINMIEKLAMAQGVSFKQLGPGTLKEIKEMVNNAFNFFLLVVLLNNFFFYAFYLRKKLWAQAYVLFYTITNSIFAITFLIEGPVLGWPWYLFNISAMFVYLYLYFGVKVLKNETTDAIPERGTSVQ